MKKAKLYAERSFEVSPIDERLYSSFLEHLGRAIYGGIYEPGHPTADADGFRTDVLEQIRGLGVSHVRYPGGNFVSGYNWKDGIGPVEDRPRRLDLAWHSIETNRFGIDEFVKWSRKAGTAVMGAVNMGTGTPRDAGELLEYCNYPGGTYWSDLRAKNGSPQPHNIKLWCIGNEMDGPWQICHLDADDYGKKARETAKIMKWVDDSIELVVCGSATTSMPTYPEWDRKVLEYTYDQVDYLSLHRYYENYGNDFNFLASFQDMDNFINTIVGTADYVKALKRGKKDICLSFDEWNVWYQQKQEPHPWQEAPCILEDHYSLLDALVFAGMGLTLVNHSDRVKIACLAQLVNVIAPVFTETGGRVIRQSIYYPFALLSRYARGTALRPVTVCEKRESCYGETPLLHTSVVYNEEEQRVSVFCLNIDQAEDMLLDLDLRSFGKVEMTERIELSGEDLSAVNTFENPCAVQPKHLPVEGGALETLTAKLPRASFTVFNFKVVC